MPRSNRLLVIVFFLGLDTAMEASPVAPPTSKPTPTR